MVVQPIFRKLLGIVWESVGSPLDVPGSVGFVENLLGFLRVLVGNSLGLKKG